MGWVYRHVPWVRYNRNHIGAHGFVFGKSEYFHQSLQCFLTFSCAQRDFCGKTEKVNSIIFHRLEHSVDDSIARINVR